MRKAGLIAIAAGLALSLPGGAIASATLTPRQGGQSYTGSFDGLPSSTIDLTLSRENGHAYLSALDWYGTPESCDAGATLMGAYYPFGPSEGRISHRAFRIHRAAPENHYVFHFTGELRDGTAAGVLRLKEEATEAGTSGVCRTGKLGWTAEK